MVSFPSLSRCLLKWKECLQMCLCDNDPWWGKNQYLMLFVRNYLYGIVCFHGSGFTSCQIYHTDINSSVYIVRFLSFSALKLFILESNCSIQLLFRELFACMSPFERTKRLQKWQVDLREELSPPRAKQKNKSVWAGKSMGRP